MAAHYDVVIIGAGAAGMMCAIEAGRRGRSVLILDHARAPGEKIRISGGGRCNFTNIHTAPDRFLSDNPRYPVSALARYTPDDFIQKIARHGIAFHEKTLGQLFCDGSAVKIITMLTTEMAEAGVELRLGTSLEAAEKTADGFALTIAGAPVACTSLVIATGGKSIPKMGASDFGYTLAARFGLGVTATRPALVPLTFDPRTLARTAALAGVAVNAVVGCPRARFEEGLLFTHRGLSGPVILQVSSYWRESEAIAIDMMPRADTLGLLKKARSESPKMSLITALSLYLPRRLVQMLVDDLKLPGPVGDMSDQTFKRVAAAIKEWSIKPTGSEGYRTAEVTLGGVDTAGLDSTTMAAKKVPGLYLIGEVVDVTGWLGGYNFQWAWASGWAAGQVA